MSLLAELQERITTTAQRVGPSTVSIGRDHRGSGVVVSEGRVLTNAHNLRDRTAQVTFADGRVTQGEVVGADPARDLVVLSTDTGDSPPIDWSTAAAEIGVGAFVVAAARDGGGARVTLGTVSQESRSFRGPSGRRITVALEHTAPMARGSSGGPLVDLDGSLVAVNTHRLGKGFTAAQLATPELRALVHDLGSGASRRPLTLGVEVAPAHVGRKLRAAVGLDDRDGLLVRGVVEASPAAAGGILVGDLITTVGGAVVATPDDLFDALSSHDPSLPLAVVVVRGADEVVLEVSFGDA